MLTINTPLCHQYTLWNCIQNDCKSIWIKHNTSLTICMCTTTTRKQSIITCKNTEWSYWTKLKYLIIILSQHSENRRHCRHAYQLFWRPNWKNLLCFRFDTSFNGLQRHGKRTHWLAANLTTLSKGGFGLSGSSWSQIQVIANAQFTGKPEDTATCVNARRTIYQQ